MEKVKFWLAFSVILLTSLDLYAQKTVPSHSGAGVPIAIGRGGEAGKFLRFAFMIFSG